MLQTVIREDIYMEQIQAFPDSSVGEESICNAGDPGSISGSGRSTGEGVGYPLQYSWTSLVTQTVILSAIWEAWLQSLDWEDPLEEGMVNPLQYSCLENPHGQRSLVGYSPWSRKESDMTEQLHFHFLFFSEVDMI